MPNTLYVDPDLGMHRYLLRIEVDETGTVQADALACCILDNGGNPVQAKQDDKDGVAVSLDVADVAALQALVTAELVGKTMAAKGYIELWIRNAEIEQGDGTGPWFHFTEKVAAVGLISARDESRNPTLPTATIPYATIESAAVGAVNTAIS